MNKDESCQELKDIRYKTMFITGNKESNLYITESSESQISIMLDKEIKQNKNEPWSKLNKATKIVKIKNYSQNYKNDKNITDNEKKDLEKYLIEAMNRKRLTSIKDVTYDKESGLIKSIPSLTFNTTTRKFTLKRNDRRTSTIKHLTPDFKKKKDTTRTKRKKEHQKET
tara:strand:+ start:144 stop:650 length:507 start_codon:yes stop_codon:yes gene_type:complete